MIHNNRIIASSIVFTGTTPPIRSFNATSTGLAVSTIPTNIFQNPQAMTGGPQPVPYTTSLSIQGNFGGSATTGLYGGSFTLLGSNVLEAPMFVPIAATTVSSTGSFLLRDSNPSYRYLDFQFSPSVTSTSGFFSVALVLKGMT